MTIEKIIGYKFINSELLSEALTHPGRAETRKNLPFNYQRLEFLGDSVLGLVVAEIIFKLYPSENEGKLAKRQAALVRSESIANVARRIGIAGYVKMSHNDKTAISGRDNDSNLEDVCEAIIGAIYLDGGFEIARKFIVEHWEEMAKSMREAPKDAKTSLQEWAQGKGLRLPKYNLLDSSGPSHAPEFTIEVSVDTGEKATAKSTSKRQAEQIAAQNLLKMICES
ncbi:MAG: ribonuclease III [Pseudomonadota bacterium]